MGIPFYGQKVQNMKKINSFGYKVTDGWVLEKLKELVLLYISGDDCDYSCPLVF